MPYSTTGCNVVGCSRYRSLSRRNRRRRLLLSLRASPLSLLVAFLSFFFSIFFVTNKRHNQMSTLRVTISTIELSIAKRIVVEHKICAVLKCNFFFKQYESRCYRSLKMHVDVQRCKTRFLGVWSSSSTRTSNAELYRISSLHRIYIHRVYSISLSIENWRQHRC